MRFRRSAGSNYVAYICVRRMFVKLAVCLKKVWAFRSPQSMVQGPDMRLLCLTNVLLQAGSTRTMC